MIEKNESFPSALQALALVAAWFAVEFVVGVVLDAAQGPLGLTSSQVWLLTSLVANGCVFATVMQYRGLTYRGLFHPAGTSMRATAIRLVPWVLLLVPALVLCVSMLVDLVTRAFPLSDSQRAMFDQMTGTDLATVLMACAIAPIVEEMLFRGVILRGFLARYGRAQAIWGSAALFGLAHLNVYQFVAALLLGAVCGWLYERSRSLVPCIALHAAYNTALNVLANLGTDNGDSTQLTLTAGVWIASMLMAGAGVEFLRRAFERREG